MLYDDHETTGRLIDDFFLPYLAIRNKKAGYAVSIVKAGATLVVRCSDIGQFRQVAEHLDGQLTATMLLTEKDQDATQALLPVLERKAGRTLINGFPTGVEVSHAMVHDGPFPATSDSRSTSVGAGAIDRFLRPVSYQDLPAFLLPAALQDANPLGLWRVRDGELVQA